jgi:hypothetical protein
MNERKDRAEDHRTVHEQGELIKQNVYFEGQVRV